MGNVEYKELKIVDIDKNLLNNFNRYQEVKKYYQNHNDNWVIKDCEYIENWDEIKLQNKITSFLNILNEGGIIFGAYDNKKMIGFATLLNKKFGSINQYIHLENMHVSYDYRHKGIGKKLFELCVSKAKCMKIEKIYISANSSEETQRFYLGIGCKDAIEINQQLAENEPYDRQMEFIID
jgi:ribosomal protein S18 acetylase RimI-like enzyme